MKTIVSRASSENIFETMAFSLNITDDLIQRLREAKEFLKDKDFHTGVFWEVDARLYVVPPEKESLFLTKDAFYLEEHPDFLALAKEIPVTLVKIHVSFLHDVWSAFLKMWTEEGDEIFSEDFGSLIRHLL
ncbi:hypothetical protein [Anaerolinea sp.]|uniref:hypothetical protein n=1 Tax=Anaerolinea sp. TaxID=1872519 RepID=UPI002ACD80A6|nr:hypothetical protein [Anaerolinea sp.]